MKQHRHKHKHMYRTLYMQTRDLHEAIILQGRVRKYDISQSFFFFSLPFLHMYVENCSSASSTLFLSFLSFFEPHTLLFPEWLQSRSRLERKTERYGSIGLTVFIYISSFSNKRCKHCTSRHRQFQAF